MEFIDEASASDYAEYVENTIYYWITVYNGRYLIAATSRDLLVSPAEVVFLKELINGELTFNQVAMASLIFVMLFLICFGGIFAAVGIWGVKTGRRLMRNCIMPTVGVVNKIYKHRTGGKHPSTTYYPVLTYNISDDVFTKKSPIGSSSPRYKIGEEVEVRYNPYKPEEFYIKKDGLKIGFFAFFITFGVIVASLSIVVYYYAT
jgi:hypothetical protein